MAEEKNEPDTSALEKKQAAKDKNRNTVAVEAKDVNTLLPEAGEDVGESQVQERIDAETEAGFRGIKVDPTPNENYSASNSAPENDLPTPETDQDLRREARLGRQLSGPEAY